MPAPTDDLDMNVPREKSVALNKGNMIRKASKEYDQLAALLTNSLLSLTTCLQTLDSQGLAHEKSFLGAIGRAPDLAFPSAFWRVKALNGGGANSLG